MTSAALAERPAVAFEDRFIAMRDGVKIHVRDYPPTLPDTGLPVICLHGLTRNARDFELVAPRIAALGRRVLAMSMRGRGRSDRDPDASHYAPPVYVQDVSAAMDALGVPRAVFIGTSMGGLITMLLAAQAPERVAATALNDVGPVLDPAGLARIASYVGKAQPAASWDAAAAATRAVNGAAFPTRLGDDAFWHIFARRTWREFGPGRFEADYDPAIANAFAPQPNAAPPADLRPLFEALARRPVLVIRGAISDLLAPEGLAAMKAIKPDLASVEVPHVGHAPTLEEEESWDALLDFLARVA